MRGVTAAAAVLLVAWAHPVLAQQPGRSWRLDVELGASVFFGASEQAALLSRSKLEWKDPRWELTLGAAFDYGEAQNPADGRFVNKRAWSTTLSADYLPRGRFSPFVFASAEGSLQRQIDSRASGGAGGRYRFVDNERSRVDLSIAALAERTDPRSDDAVTGVVRSIGRWSARLRARHTLGSDRVRLDFVSFYKPKMDDTRDYTVEIAPSAQYALSSIIGLKVSLMDTYDSTARSRGARSNNDGQLLFSILASVR